MYNLSKQATRDESIKNRIAAIIQPRKQTELLNAINQGRNFAAANMMRASKAIIRNAKKLSAEFILREAKAYRDRPDFSYPVLEALAWAGGGAIRVQADGTVTDCETHTPDCLQSEYFGEDDAPITYCAQCGAWKDEGGRYVAEDLKYLIVSL